MVRRLSASSLLLLAASATAQKLNSWPQHNYGGTGLTTDNDINTSEARNIATGAPADFYLLFNFRITLTGFYIQSSGDFITDYDVSALIGDIGLVKWLDVGQVCGATGNFTFVPLIDPEDGGSVRSDTLSISVSGAKGNSSTAIINEIWPVFPGDEIFDPGNTSPCQAATK